MRVPDFADNQRAFQHYAKHAKGVVLKPKGKATVKKGKPGAADGPDMPEFKTFAEYRAAARAFLSGPAPPGVLQGFDGDDLLRVDPKSGYFGVLSKDGVIRSFYRPQPDPVGWFLSQVDA